MIREIQPNEISQIEDLMDGFLKQIIQNEEQFLPWKDKLLKDLETKERVILAAFSDENTPFGFGILIPSNNEISAFHPLDEIWTELFTQVFAHIKRNQSVIRIRGSAVPESMHDFMIMNGFSKDILAIMSIQRSEIESLTLDVSPENLSIVKYDKILQQLVAEMMFESYLKASWAHQYPDYFGSLNACEKAIAEWGKKNHTSILSIDCNIIGSCHITTEGIQRHIGNVAIKPGYRKRGFGRFLVTSVLLDAVNENPEIESVHLATTLNSPAFYLYEGLGFITDSIRPQFAWSKRE